MNGLTHWVRRSSEPLLEGWRTARRENRGWKWQRIEWETCESKRRSAPWRLIDIASRDACGGIAEVVENRTEIRQVLRLNRPDLLQGVAISRHRPAASDDSGTWKELPQTHEFVRQIGIVTGIDDAQSHRSGMILSRGPRSFRRTETGPEVNYAPSQICRRRRDQQRAQLMQLPRRRDHHEHRSILSAGERAGRPTQELTDYCGRKMLMGGREVSCAPLVPDGMDQRTNYPA